MQKAALTCLLPLLGMLLAAAAPAPVPDVPDQNVLAANRQGMMEYCFAINSLDFDLQTKLDAFGRRLKESAKGSGKAHKLGEHGALLQGSGFVDLQVLASQLNRPTRYLCDEIADQASAPGPLPAMLTR